MPNVLSLFCEVFAVAKVKLLGSEVKFAINFAVG